MMAYPISSSLSAVKPGTNLTGGFDAPTSPAGHFSNADDLPPPGSSSACGGSTSMKSDDGRSDQKRKRISSFLLKKSDLPHFANVRDGGNLDDGPPDILLSAFCFLIGFSMLGLCLGLAIAIDPLGIVHAPYCPTEAC